MFIILYTLKSYSTYRDLHFSETGRILYQLMFVSLCLIEVARVSQVIQLFIVSQESLYV